MTATEYVVLVDEHNQAIGTAEKLAAHQNNLLHRAFSVFIFRYHPMPELLLQQRAFHKYHSRGLWTNTCCSHPRINEPILAAGERRLQEELGISATLSDTGWFHYQTQLESGLSENEIDHVLIGNVSPETQVHPNASEVHSYRWISLDELDRELATTPDQFTFWFATALAIARTAFILPGNISS